MKTGFGVRTVAKTSVGRTSRRLARMVASGEAVYHRRERASGGMKVAVRTFRLKPGVRLNGRGPRRR
jgi:hypothetical protein